MKGPLTRQTRAEKLLALLGAFATLGLSLPEQLRKLTVPVAFGVLDVGLQAKRVAKALLGKPDEVVVLVLGAVTCPASVPLDIARRPFVYPGPSLRLPVFTCRAAPKFRSSWTHELGRI